MYEDNQADLLLLGTLLYYIYVLTFLKQQQYPFP